MSWIESLLDFLALPQTGLSAVFVGTLVSATLVPIGSEFLVFGVVKANSALFWPAMLVATAGSTIGGGISWWMGFGAERAYEKVKHQKPKERRALQLLQQFGPKACLISWVPVIGDPLCALAGWLKLPFWPCFIYMGIGKLARYVVYTALLLWVFPGKIG